MQVQTTEHTVQSTNPIAESKDVTNVSKTQIDRLGDRLKKREITETDLRMLDEFRHSFYEAYKVVISTIKKELGLEPTGRPAKSTTSIYEKLQRESIRLTQVQDIAGCRLIVFGVLEQERVVGLLAKVFEDAEIIDRRATPSHGYRAVHLIVTRGEKLVEVQVRTSYQHVWAELSEKLSDLFDPTIKYGGGDETLIQLLAHWSGVVQKEENVERSLAGVQQQLAELLSQTSLSETDEANLSDLKAEIVMQEKERVERRADNLAAMREAIEDFANWTEAGGADAVSH
jgi:ppGpp synthetase/RelA/SpoT-type nucleotidyltranferase